MLFSISAIAHTTTLIPHINKDGRKTVKVLHFHPFTGTNLMGIRSGAEDTKHLKGLNAIFIIHDGEERNLHAVAIPDYYNVGSERRETYTTPVNKKYIGSKYTRSRMPVKLVYQEQAENRSEATRRELEIKGLSHGYKMKIIE